VSKLPEDYKWKVRLQHPFLLLQVKFKMAHV
jgi:hypothetical protein